MSIALSVSNFVQARGMGVAALAVGLTLTTLSVPRSGAAFVSLSAPIAMFQLGQGRSLTALQLAEIEEDLHSALIYGVNNAELHSQLSYISLRRLLMDKQNTAERAEFLVALESVEAALKGRPLDAYLWTRYTHLSYLLDGLSPYTLAGLDRSFKYGSKERQLFQFRMVLCLAEWEKLPLVLREATHKQIEFGASHHNVWGYVLADLPENAKERLLGFLASTSADVERALRIERSLRRARSDN